MIEKLEAVTARFAAVEARLQSPGATDDMSEYKRLMKERKELLPIFEKYSEYKAAISAANEAKCLMSDSDAELRALAAEEYDSARLRAEAAEDELKALLIPADKNDSRSVVMEIRAGAGGEEAALFAASLFRMYQMYGEAKGFSVEPVGMNETELGGYKEISFTVEGDGAYSRLKFESGVHRVQRVPDTESGGRIHTSTVTVAVLPEAEEVELVLDPADIQVDTFRSSGAGGQKVNKTESAIRVTHLPTGTVVECQDERSQHKNRDKAMKVLRSKIYEKLQREADAELASKRKNQVGTGDRSERIRTYNFPQGRVTDHRIGLTLYKLDAFMNGSLDELIDALAAADRLEKLKNEEN